ncbi:MAG: alkaline phosphatase family protein [Actinobacteria bacterium]|nr:alkaline phosphatase family protein [Actinomycetota bacterium]
MHLADVTPSIFAGLGLIDPYGRNEFEPSPHGRECLLLVDGLGTSIIREFSAQIPIFSSLTNMNTVETSFPSTTATSLTTLMTGEMPGTHGMLGYTVRVPRSGGRILNALKWDERVDPMIWQPIPTLFERAAREGIKVSHVASKRYEESGFTRAAFRGAEYRGANVLDEMISEVQKSFSRSPSFTYVYINELDVAGHSDGVGSEKWLGALSYVNKVISTLLEKLPRGVRLWITADHGMINVDEKIVIGEDNSLVQGISLIAGEPRARHLYLTDDYDGDGVNEIALMWRQTLGEKVEVFTRREAISIGLFGSVVSLDSQERMGDLIVIARDGVVLIDPARKVLESAMVGHHGALTNDERFVPLAMREIGS